MFLKVNWKILKFRKGRRIKIKNPILSKKNDLISLVLKTSFFVTFNIRLRHWILFWLNVLLGGFHFLLLWMCVLISNFLFLNSLFWLRNFFSLRYFRLRHFRFRYYIRSGHHIRFRYYFRLGHYFRLGCYLRLSFFNLQC